MSKTLPIIPIRTGVLFPGVSLPITAGRTATLRAIDVALKDPEHRVFAVAQRDTAEEVLPEGLYTVGTVAKVGAVQRGGNGVRLVLEGLERGIALRVVPHDGYLQATVTPAVESPPANPKDATFVAMHREVRERAAELARKRGVSDHTVAQLLESITQPGALADIVAGYLDTPTAERQSVLEELAVEERLRRVLVMVQRPIEVLAAQEDIQSTTCASRCARSRTSSGKGTTLQTSPSPTSRPSSPSSRCRPKRARKSIASSRVSHAPAASRWSRR